MWHHLAKGKKIQKAVKKKEREEERRVEQRGQGRKKRRENKTPYFIIAAIPSMWVGHSWHNHLLKVLTALKFILSKFYPCIVPFDHVTPVIPSYPLPSHRIPPSFIVCVRESVGERES